MRAALVQWRTEELSSRYVSGALGEGVSTFGMEFDSSLSNLMQVCVS
jgi:hypothetical protein